MTPSKLFIVLALGLGAAACESRVTTQTVMTPAPLTGSEQACADYGFTIGTAGYDRCVSRERAARAQGRMSRDYALAQVTADARDACTSYGLDPGTPRYDRCVGREVDSRRYRDDAAQQVYVPASPPPPPAGYYPAPAYSPAPYADTRNNNTTGTQAFRDEYGFRYDADGNRIDRNGNVISPQSTQP